MDFNVWLKKTTTVYVGGDPNKGEAPTITLKVEKPQVLVDPNKGTIIILENK